MEVVEIVNKELKRGSVKVNPPKLSEEEIKEVKGDLSLLKILKKLSKSNKEVRINKEISANLTFNDLEGYLKIQFTKSLKENFNLDFILETKDKEESLISYFCFEYLEDLESSGNTFRDQYIKGIKFIRKSIEKLVYKDLDSLDYKIILSDLVEILKKSKRFFK